MTKEQNADVVERAVMRAATQYGIRMVHVDLANTLVEDLREIRYGTVLSDVGVTVVPREKNSTGPMYLCKLVRVD